MERIKLKKRLLLEVLLIVLPLTVQIYNIVAGKLSVASLAGNLITLVLLLVAVLFVFFRYARLMSKSREYKISVLFAISVIPTILFNLDLDTETIVRAFCSISFVPLAFALGTIISFQIKYVDKQWLYNILLLLPVFSVAIMMQSMPMLLVGADFGRDAILAVSVFLPLILVIQEKYFKVILLVFVTYWSIISAKRTAFLCVGLAFLFLFLSNILSITIKRFFRFVGAIIILGGISYYAYTNNPDFAAQTDWAIERFKAPKDNESNRERTDMYQGTYTAFSSSTLLEQLFGHGYKGVEKNLYGRPAHNDLLEILYDYGLISLIIYLAFLAQLLIRGISMFRANKQNIYLLFTMLNLFLLSMMNCMITTPAFVFVNMFCVGFSLNCFQESK